MKELWQWSMSWKLNFAKPRSVTFTLVLVIPNRYFLINLFHLDLICKPSLSGIYAVIQAPCSFYRVFKRHAHDLHSFIS